MTASAVLALLGAVVSVAASEESAGRINARVPPVHQTKVRFPFIAEHVFIGTAPNHDNRRLSSRQFGQEHGGDGVRVNDTQVRVATQTSNVPGSFVPLIFWFEGGIRGKGKDDKANLANDFSSRGLTTILDLHARPEGLAGHKRRHARPYGQDGGILYQQIGPQLVLSGGLGMGQRLSSDLNAFRRVSDRLSGHAPKKGSEYPQAASGEEQQAGEPRNPPVGIRIPLALMLGLGSNIPLALGLLDKRRWRGRSLCALGAGMMLSGGALMLSLGFPATWGWPV